MLSQEMEIASMADIALLPLDQQLLPDSLAARFGIPLPEMSGGSAARPPRISAVAGPGSAFSAPAVGLNAGPPPNSSYNSWHPMAAALHGLGQQAQHGGPAQHEGFLQPFSSARLGLGLGPDRPSTLNSTILQQAGPSHNPYAGFRPVHPGPGQPAMPYNPYAGSPLPIKPTPRALTAGAAASLSQGSPDIKCAAPGALNPQSGHPAADPAQQGMRPSPVGPGPVPPPGWQYTQSVSDPQHVMQAQMSQHANLLAAVRSQGSLPSSKKARRAWTPELHTRFVKAVTELGVDTAVPKQIMLAMNVEGLTRENVASHLQKFRLQLQRDRD